MFWSYFLLLTNNKRFFSYAEQTFSKQWHTIVLYSLNDHLIGTWNTCIKIIITIVDYRLVRFLYQITRHWKISRMKVITLYFSEKTFLSRYPNRHQWRWLELARFSEEETRDAFLKKDFLSRALILWQQRRRNKA